MNLSLSLEYPVSGVRRYWFDELSCAICIHYLFYMVLVLVADPQNIVAEGLWQPIGPCNETHILQSPTGIVCGGEGWRLG